MGVKSNETVFRREQFYWKVDNSEAYNILKNNLDDFDLIKKALTGYLRQ